MPDRECVICEGLFTPRSSSHKTCGLDCQIQHRRKLSRESAARRYRPRFLRPDTACEICQVILAVPKTGPMPRWCEPCKANREHVRARKRQAVRRCWKCSMVLPEAERRPGIAVCDGCRVDPRKARAEHEQRRRLRKYGLTQEQYDQMMAEQDDRCAACCTDTPGFKGWCIDHDHQTGRVRGILCTPCNRAIGFAQESPVILRALADWLEQQQLAQIG